MNNKYIVIFLVIISSFIGIERINALEIRTNDLTNISTTTSTVGDLPEVGFGQTGDACKDLIGENLGKVIKLGISILRLAGAIIAIVNGMMIMMGAVASKDPGAIKKAGDKCVKLAIVLLVIGVFPTILRVIGKLFSYDLSCIF